MDTSQSWYARIEYYASDADPTHPEHKTQSRGTKKREDSPKSAVKPDTLRAGSSQKSGNSSKTKTDEKSLKRAVRPES